MELLAWVLLQTVVDILSKAAAGEEVTMGNILTSNKWATVRPQTLAGPPASHVVLQTCLHHIHSDSRSPRRTQILLIKPIAALIWHTHSQCITLNRAKYRCRILLTCMEDTLNLLGSHK